MIGSFISTLYGAASFVAAQTYSFFVSDASADERSHEVAAAADMLAVVRDLTDAGVCYAEGDEEHERQALARARADLNAASQDIAIAVVEHMVR